jgi:hypothetical protein
VGSLCVVEISFEAFGPSKTGALIKGSDEPVPKQRRNLLCRQQIAEHVYRPDHWPRFVDIHHLICSLSLVQLADNIIQAILHSFDFEILSVHILQYFVASYF